MKDFSSKTYFRVSKKEENFSVFVLFKKDEESIIFGSNNDANMRAYRR